ncbi:glycosyltransferase [Bifidobacterium felsineum]|uniref:Glycosyltransferase subfamily 4-like N-terminal domain-containing protein n=1 Tax=Bifidobacterium felsineum TaxID=2045440 RepID=A0A2M9HHU1_9BIFI|nr:glycosyltransferase [Bifidobacterium felsineum]PJM76392.1 hypothetical protein CSQ86_09480 [Bifidobacterium felsineum]
MRILHYALGFPPYRSGGLTRYVNDVTNAQHDAGHDVAMLWPGRMNKSKTPYIKQHRSIKGISSFELCNPLPVVLDQQVSEPEVFHYPVDGACYKRLFAEYQPDIIHIHTLQGLHREFVDAARDTGIPTVFTTHDFFGLYPMNAIYPMDHDLTDEECTAINASAPSVSKLRLLQSPMVRWIKSSHVLRSMSKFAVKAKSRTKTQSILNMSMPYPPVGTLNKLKPYSDFRNYEIDILNGMDEILYNSEVSKQAYERYCRPRFSEVLPITHAHMPTPTNGNRVGQHNRIHVAFLGGDRPYKGLSLIQEIASTFRNENNRTYHFDVYGAQGNNDDWITYHQPFADFTEEMLNWDIVAVPSLTYESFGFVVPEALSCGIPVIVSDCVGAKELIRYEYGIVFRAGDLKQLHGYLLAMDDEALQEIHFKICNTYTLQNFANHLHDLETIYQQFFIRKELINNRKTGTGK